MRGLGKSGRVGTGGRGVGYGRLSSVELSSSQLGLCMLPYRDVCLEPH